MRLGYQTILKVILGSLVLVGCTQSPEDKMIADAKKDRFLGGVVSSGTGIAIPATEAHLYDAAGTLVGAFVVQSLDAKMSEANRLKMANMLEYQSSDQWKRWQDTSNNTLYSLKAGTPAFGENEVCRHYDLVAKAPDNFSQASGVACRQSNGNWLLNA